jgi:hypothetical protein
MKLMELSDAILTILGRIENGAGRTTLQKLLYFASSKQIMRTAFRPYYYGPYSDEVYLELQSLVSLHFIEEKTETYASGHTGHTYRLTMDGQMVLPPRSTDTENLDRLVELAGRHFGLDQRLLSAAAKAHFVLSSHNLPLTFDVIRAEARNLGWEISAGDADKVVDFLSDLGLVTRAS